MRAHVALVCDVEVGVERGGRITADPHVEGRGLFDPVFPPHAPVGQFVISKRKVYGLFFVGDAWDALESFWLADGREVLPDC